MTTWDCRWKPVTCSECKREFVCSPLDDYYDSTTATDGLCFTCLLASHGLREVGK